MNTGIIGAGASGIMAAISAARSGAKVTLYEHSDSIGKKLLITGNGKCNFSNISMDASRFHSGTDSTGRIGRILKRFGTKECTDFFESIGVMYRERKGGIYPYTDTAESVRSALKLEIYRLGVETICNCGRISIKTGRVESSGEKSDCSGCLHEINGRRYDRIIIACGSRVAPRTGSDGSGYELLKGLGVKHTDIYPALTPLTVEDDLSVLKGVRCDAYLTLIDASGHAVESSAGELQPYEHGLSGICAMDISGNACRLLGKGERCYIETDFLPRFTDDEVKKIIEDRLKSFPERNLAELLTGIFPKKLIGYLVHPIDTRREGFLNELVNAIKHHRYELSKEMVSDFSRAQTVAGGVPVDIIDDDCMLSGRDGIYVTGELLDADGVCGGYNLHFAWATGFIAGRQDL